MQNTTKCKWKREISSSCARTVCRTTSYVPLETRSSSRLTLFQFDEDILEIIAAHTPPDSPAQPQALSEALCKSAQEASEETGSASPFMCRAIEEGLDFMGGKKDDISVLVAVVADRDGLEGST